MAFDHSACDHPRTPAGRAACRKKHMNMAVDHALANKPHTMTTKEAARNARNNKNRADAAAGRMAKRRTGGGRSNKPAIVIDATRVLRANMDVKDIPHPFKPALSAAWKANHTVHTGTPFNAAERVVELRSEHGTVYLVWRCDNPHGVNGIRFRPADSSVFQSVASVNEALRMLDGE